MKSPGSFCFRTGSTRCSPVEKKSPGCFCPTARWSLLGSQPSLDALGKGVQRQGPADPCEFWLWDNLRSSVHEGYGRGGGGGPSPHCKCKCLCLCLCVCVVERSFSLPRVWSLEISKLIVMRMSLIPEIVSQSFSRVSQSKINSYDRGALKRTSRLLDCYL